jgi:hypothetical protein
LSALQKFKVNKAQRMDFPLILGHVLVLLLHRFETLWGRFFAYWNDRKLVENVSKKFAESSQRDLQYNINSFYPGIERRKEKKKESFQTMLDEETYPFRINASFLSFSVFFFLVLHSVNLHSNQIVFKSKSWGKKVSRLWERNFKTILEKKILMNQRNTLYKVG